MITEIRLKCLRWQQAETSQDRGDLCPEMLLTDTLKLITSYNKTNPKQLTYCTWPTAFRSRDNLRRRINQSKSISMVASLRHTASSGPLSIRSLFSCHFDNIRVASALWFPSGSLCQKFCSEIRRNILEDGLKQRGFL